MVFERMACTQTLKPFHDDNKPMLFVTTQHSGKSRDVTVQIASEIYQFLYALGCKAKNMSL